MPRSVVLTATATEGSVSTPATQVLSTDVVSAILYVASGEIPPDAVVDVMIETGFAPTRYVSLNKEVPAVQLYGPVTGYTFTLRHRGTGPDGRTPVPVGVVLDTQ